MLALAEFEPIWAEETQERQEDVKAARKYIEAKIQERHPGPWLSLSTQMFALTRDDGTPPEQASVSIVRTPERIITTSFVDLPTSHQRLDLMDGSEAVYTIVQGDAVCGERKPITPQHMDDLEEIAYHLTSK